MDEREEYLSPSWAGLRRDDSRLFYLTKEKIHLNRIAEVFEGIFLIEEGIAYAMKEGMLYHKTKDGKYLDVFEEQHHRLLLKKGTVLSFGYREYEYIPKAPLHAKSLSNTRWDNDFLQHVIHILNLKTKTTKDKSLYF